MSDYDDAFHRHQKQQQLNQWEAVNRHRYNDQHHPPNRSRGGSFLMALFLAGGWFLSAQGISYAMIKALLNSAGNQQLTFLPKWIVLFWLIFGFSSSVIVFFTVMMLNNRPLEVRGFSEIFRWATNIFLWATRRLVIALLVSLVVPLFLAPFFELNYLINLIK